MAFSIEFPSPNAPAPMELFGDASAPEWLVDQAVRLARSPVYLDRVAMVGLVGRLGSAATTAPKVLLRRMFSGEESPGDRARQWARSLGEEMVDDTEQLFLDRMLLLNEEILLVAKEIHRGDMRGMEDKLYYIAIERDLLESVAWVLRMADPHGDVGRNVKRSLGLLDINAKQWFGVHGGFVAPCDRSPLLSSVNWQEPDSWWAQCGETSMNPAEHVLPEQPGFFAKLFGGQTMELGTKTTIAVPVGAARYVIVDSSGTYYTSARRIGMARKKKEALQRKFGARQFGIVDMGR